MPVKKSQIFLVTCVKIFVGNVRKKWVNRVTVAQQVGAALLRRFKHIRSGMETFTSDYNRLTSLSVVKILC